MKINKDEIQLIKVIHKMFHSTEDKKVQNGLRYVLKDVLGRFLIQMKHYEPWVSEKAQKEINEKLPGIKISQIKLHDCNVPKRIPLTREQKKLFVNGNSKKNKSFHLEHDPPTIQVANSILNEESIPNEEIQKKLEHYRLCFITVEEDNKLDKKVGSQKDRPMRINNAELTQSRLMMINLVTQ